jgi:hypothetical protein
LKIEGNFIDQPIIKARFFLPAQKSSDFLCSTLFNVAQILLIEVSMSRLLSLVITTFMIAVIYGLFQTTMDFLRPNYDPVAAGHHAANGVYSLFGGVDDAVSPHTRSAARTASITHKVAVPYAVTANLSAFFGGKLEVGMENLFHAAQNRTSVAQRQS